MISADRPVVNPDRFRIGPRRAVSAILPAPMLDECVHALQVEGFLGRAIEVLSGEAGRKVLDIEGRRHGVKGRLIRIVQVSGSIHNEMLNYDAALRNGSVVVVVSISNAAESILAATILAAHRGERVISYGRRGSQTEWL
jgi:hypothetical protein